MAKKPLAYEKCGFKCPQCESQLSMSNDEKTVKCSNKNCDYERVIGDLMSSLFDLYK